jgi:DNA-binding NarL/FixJ family response regulator
VFAARPFWHIRYMNLTQPDGAQSIQVALVEDEPGMRGRLADAITASERLELVFCAATLADIAAWLRGGGVPDVLLVDLGLPDGSGIEAIELCARLAPQAEVMVITLFADEANMLRAFEAGARGYLLKDGTESDLARHVLQLHAGGSPMSPVIARRLLARLAPPRPAVAVAAVPAAMRLTPRESEVLTLVSRGYSYAEAARLLGVAASTIQVHVKSIYSKLAVHSKTQAVFEARQMGLLDP